MKPVRSHRSTRPTTRTGGAHPSILATAVLLLAAVLALAGCGGSTGESASGQTTTAAPLAAGSATPAAPESSPAPGQAQTTVRVYFLRGDKLGVAERRLPQTAAVAAAALTALCGGPAPSERAAGLSTAVPDGTTLESVTVKDGVATVDLSAAFASGGGSLSMQARVAQVVYTATQFPTVEAVDLRLGGEPLTTLGGEGLMLEPGQTRADWRDFESNIFVEQPGVGAVLTSPFILRGTAMVFEGSFMAELADERGDLLVKVAVQASAGGPERGDFRESLVYETSVSSGTLIVYDLSAEDGSRQDEVRIPVTFAQ